MQKTKFSSELDRERCGQKAAFIQRYDRDCHEAFRYWLGVTPVHRLKALEKVLFSE